MILLSTIFLLERDDEDFAKHSQVQKLLQKLTVIAEWREFFVRQNYSEIIIRSNHTLVILSGMKKYSLQIFETSLP